MRKESAKAKARREAAIAAVFTEAGIQTKDNSWRVEYQLDTPVGKLVVVPHEDWIHCKFEDPVAAKEVIGSVSPAGKWNHYPGTQQRRLTAADVEAVLELLKRYRLWPMPKQAPSVDQDRPPNFRDGKQLFLVRCFACEPQYGRENVACAVAAGECASCGWREGE